MSGGFSHDRLRAEGIAAPLSPGTVQPEGGVIKDVSRCARIHSRRRRACCIALLTGLACGLLALLPAFACTSVSTGNGGWLAEPLASGRHVCQRLAPRADHGWLVGGGDIYRTSDGGASVTVQARHSVSFTDVTFVDAKHGWAVGCPSSANTGTAIVCRTTHGGKTWMRVRLGVVGGLNAVSFANGKVGWAVGVPCCTPQTETCTGPASSSTPLGSPTSRRSLAAPGP